MQSREQAGHHEGDIVLRRAVVKVEGPDDVVDLAVQQLTAQLKFLGQLPGLGGAADLDVVGRGPVGVADEPLADLAVGGDRLQGGPAQVVGQRDAFAPDLVLGRLGVLREIVETADRGTANGSRADGEG